MTDRVVEVDWADENEVNRFGERTAELLGLKVKTLTEAGPAGWPVLRFGGDEDAVGRLIAAYDPTDPMTRLYDVEYPFDALDEAECEAIGADGRDGRGYVTESNLTDGERRSLEQFRIESAVVEHQYAWVDERFGRQSADLANYGWAVGGLDPVGVDYATKVYGRGVLTTRSTKVGEFEDSWSEGF